MAQVLQRKTDQKKCVCRLERMHSDGKTVLDGAGGTGFHYGGGWIITNSHVVGPNAQHLHELRITFDNADGKPRYAPKRRVCFFTDIKYNGNLADFKTADVAFVLLDTEDEKKGLPPAMNNKNIWVPLEPRASPKIDDRTYCFHYGWRGDPARPPEAIVESPDEVVEATYGNGLVRDPTILDRKSVTTSGGSSGAPVFSLAGGYLVGVHFAGWSTNGSCLDFNTSTREIAGILVSKAADLNRLKDLLSVFNQNLSDGIVTNLPKLWVDIQIYLQSLVDCSNRAIRLVSPIFNT